MKSNGVTTNSQTHGKRDSPKSEDNSHKQESLKLSNESGTSKENCYCSMCTSTEVKIRRDNRTYCITGVRPQT